MMSPDAGRVADHVAIVVGICLEFGVADMLAAPAEPNQQ